MCATGFYGLTRDSEEPTVTDDVIIEHAKFSCTDSPETFCDEFDSPSPT